SRPFKTQHRDNSIIIPVVCAKYYIRRVAQVILCNKCLCLYAIYQFLRASLAAIINRRIQCKGFAGNKNRIQVGGWSYLQFIVLVVKAFFGLVNMRCAYAQFNVGKFIGVIGIVDTCTYIYISSLCIVACFIAGCCAVKLEAVPLPVKSQLAEIDTPLYICAGETYRKHTEVACLYMVSSKGLIPAQCQLPVTGLVAEHSQS